MMSAKQMLTNYTIRYSIRALCRQIAENSHSFKLILLLGFLRISKRNQIQTHKQNTFLLISKRAYRINISLIHIFFHNFFFLVNANAKHSLKLNQLTGNHTIQCAHMLYIQTLWAICWSMCETWIKFLFQWIFQQKRLLDIKTTIEIIWMWIIFA